MSESFWAYGSVIQLGDGATSETFTAIAEVVDVVPPAESRESIRVTNHGSANRTHEDIPGLRDGGQVTFKVNWLPTNATHNKSTGLRKHWEANANSNWKIILPDSLGTISFTGHAVNWNPTLPLAAQGSLDLTIKVSGMPTYSV